MWELQIIVGKAECAWRGHPMIWGAPSAIYTGLPCASNTCTHGLSEMLLLDFTQCWVRDSPESWGHCVFPPKEGLNASLKLFLSPLVTFSPSVNFKSLVQG